MSVESSDTRWEIHPSLAKAVFNGFGSILDPVCGTKVSPEKQASMIIDNTAPTEDQYFSRAEHLTELMRQYRNGSAKILTEWSRRRKGYGFNYETAKWYFWLLVYLCVVYVTLRFYSHPQGYLPCRDSWQFLSRDKCADYNLFQRFAWRVYAHFDRHPVHDPSTFYLDWFLKVTLGALLPFILWWTCPRTMKVVVLDWERKAGYNTTSQKELKSELAKPQPDAYLVRTGDEHDIQTDHPLRKHKSSVAKKDMKEKFDVGTLIGPALISGVSYAQSLNNFMATKQRHFKVTNKFEAVESVWELAKQRVRELFANALSAQPVEFPKKWGPATIASAWMQLCSKKLGMMEAQVKTQETLAPVKPPRAIINCGLGRTISWTEVMRNMEETLFGTLRLHGVKHLTRDEWTMRWMRVVAQYWLSCDEDSYDARQNKHLRQHENDVVHMFEAHLIDGHHELRKDRYGLKLRIAWGDEVVSFDADETFRVSGDRGTSILNAINSFTALYYALLRHFGDGVSYHDGLFYLRDELVSYHPFIEGDDLCIAEISPGGASEHVREFRHLLPKLRGELGLTTVCSAHETERDFCSMFTDGITLSGNIKRSLTVCHTASSIVKRDKCGHAIQNVDYHAVAATKYFSYAALFAEIPVMGVWFLQLGAAHLRSIGDAASVESEVKYGSTMDATLSGEYAKLLSMVNQSSHTEFAWKLIEKHLPRAQEIHHHLICHEYLLSDFLTGHRFSLPGELADMIKPLSVKSEDGEGGGPSIGLEQSSTVLTGVRDQTPKCPGTTSDDAVSVPTAGDRLNAESQHTKPGDAPRTARGADKLPDPHSKRSIRRAAKAARDLGRSEGGKSHVHTGKRESRTLATGDEHRDAVELVFERGMATVRPHVTPPGLFLPPGLARSV